MKRNFNNIKIFIDMNKTRKEILDRIFKEYHGRLVPMMHWGNHSPMRYAYNALTDSIECDCGVSVVIPFSNEELSLKNIDKLIDILYDKIRAYFKQKYNIELYDIED